MQRSSDALPDLSGVPSIEADDTAVVRVSTDVLVLEIGTRGGDLLSATLPEYPKDKKRPDLPIQILSAAPDAYHVIRSGIRSQAGGAEPNHLAEFVAAQREYRLGDGDQSITVELSWTDGAGLAAVKRYTLERGSYAILVEQQLLNQSAEEWKGAPYVQLVRTAVPRERSMTDVETYSFNGPILYDGDSYEKLDAEDLAVEPIKSTLTGGWIAAIQHHFLSAVVPEGTNPVRYDANYRNSRFYVSAISNAESIAAGEQRTFTHKVFVGPKLQDQLEVLAPGLKLTVDYGVLTILAQPLFWLLARAHDLVRNWGWAIILVTILIKIVFYKLTQTSGRSMAKMRKLQPRIKNLQDRHKEDKQALSKAMMDLYKREQVNPLAGCLPILLQMPFFLAFYWVLLESVEMRQAPFMLWITDLSSRDPYFVLPLLMGVAMFFQTRLNPAPPDPVQAKVMQVLPLVFTVFFAFFPAGLVLYWLTNTLLSMLQQWRINKVVEADGKA